MTSILNNYKNDEQTDNTSWMKTRSKPISNSYYVSTFLMSILDVLYLCQFDHIYPMKTFPVITLWAFTVFWLKNFPFKNYLNVSKLQKSTFAKISRKWFFKFKNVFMSSWANNLTASKYCNIERLLDLLFCWSKSRILYFSCLFLFFV